MCWTHLSFSFSLSHYVSPNLLSTQPLNYFFFFLRNMPTHNNKDYAKPLHTLFLKKYHLDILTVTQEYKNKLEFKKCISTLYFLCMHLNVIGCFLVNNLELWKGNRNELLYYSYSFG